MAGTGSDGGQTLTPQQIIAVWIKAGGPISGAPAALAHAMAESSGRAGVTSTNPDGGTNVGVWQLDTKGVGSGYSVSQLSEPLTNAKITVKATGGGKNWAEWDDQWTKFAPMAHQQVSEFASKVASQAGGDPFAWADDILHGVENIGGDIRGAFGQLLGLPSQVLDFLSALEKPVQGLMWFVNPANWARMIAGGVGFLLLAAGLIALGMAA